MFDAKIRPSPLPPRTPRTTRSKERSMRGTMYAIDLVERILDGDIGAIICFLIPFAIVSWWMIRIYILPARRWKTPEGPTERTYFYRKKAGRGRESTARVHALAPGRGTGDLHSGWWPHRGDSQRGRRRARACRERPRSRQLCRDVVRQPYWYQIKLTLSLLLHCQCPILRPLASHFLYILYMRWPANKT